MEPLTPWIAPGLSMFTLLVIWWLNRKTAVSDRLAEQTGNLSGNVFQTAGELIDWLKKELADVRQEMEEERTECRKMQEEMQEEIEGLHRKLAGQRRWQEMLEALLVRHGVQLPPRLEETA